MIGGLLGGLFGGSKAGSRAAGMENEYVQRAIDQLEGVYGRARNMFMPSIRAGNVAGQEQVRGSTMGGLADRLSEIFNTNVFGNLVDERSRAMQGQLAAGGLTRSGRAMQDMAAIPQDIGLGLENMLMGRTNQLVNQALGSVRNLAGLDRDTSMGIADFLARIGENRGAGHLTDAQSQAAGGQNFLNLAGTAASIFFSDPRLKTNVRRIAGAEIRELPVYEWDWIPEVSDQAREMPAVGFMADDVERHYPEHVHRFGGFRMVDYGGLLATLRAAA